MDNTKNISETEDIDSPTIYSLSHPLDDSRPVLMKHGNILPIFEHIFSIMQE